MSTLFIIAGIVLPSISVGRHFGVFDGIAAASLLMFINQQVVGMAEVLAAAARALRK